MVLRYQINTGFYLPGRVRLPDANEFSTDVSGRRQFSPCVAFLGSTSPTPMILAGLVDPGDDTSDGSTGRSKKATTFNN